MIASNLKRRAERSNGTFLVTDRTLVRTLGLNAYYRKHVKRILSKIPKAEIWHDLHNRTTFKLESETVLRLYDYLAERGALS